MSEVSKRQRRGQRVRALASTVKQTTNIVPGTATGMDTDFGGTAPFSVDVSPIAHMDVLFDTTTCVLDSLQ